MFLIALIFSGPQVLPIFPRLVDLSPDRFQDALARILQVVLSSLLIALLMGIILLFYLMAFHKSWVGQSAFFGKKIKY
jgi:hypothetical protein